jgi:hypothetical protein
MPWNHTLSSPTSNSVPIVCLLHCINNAQLIIPVSDECLVAYIKTRDGNDKAGGYGIQSAGSILIERIEGSYDNVVGLPLRVTLDLIEKLMVPEEILDDNMDNMFSHSDDGE